MKASKTNLLWENICCAFVYNIFLLLICDFNILEKYLTIIFSYSKKYLNSLKFQDLDLSQLDDLSKVVVVFMKSLKYFADNE